MFGVERVVDRRERVESVFFRVGRDRLGCRDGEIEQVMLER